MFKNVLYLTVFEKGEEQDSEVEEENEEEQFDEDVDLYSNVLKKMLPGKIFSFKLNYYRNRK